MNAAELVSLACAHGVDLHHIAGVASNLDGIAHKRARTAVEKRLGVDVRESVRGRESRSYRRPAWSGAELAQGACGLGVIPWSAALYSFAGSRDGFWVLWAALAIEAQRIARRESWAPQVIGIDGRRHFYREALASLVLDQDAHQHIFAAAPQLYAVCLEVTVWEQQLRDPFRSLQAVYERWLTVARSVIGRWIRADNSAAIPT